MQINLKIKKIFQGNYSIYHILAGVLAFVVFVYLTIRNTGLYPCIFADEWLYSTFSRLAPIKESIVPSYLYLGFFSITKYFGKGFLEAARVLNLLLFIGSFPFIYLTARKYLSTPLSLYVAALSLISPLNVYTAFFMPESMYFIGIWILIWFVLVHKGENVWLYGTCIGLILACLSMIKMHGIFLIPGLLLFFFIDCLLRDNAGLFKSFVLLAVIIIVSFISIRLIVGYLIAGKSGLNILGGMYGSIAHGALGFNQILIRIMESAHVIMRHIIILVSLFGVPLFYFFSFMRNHENRNKEIVGLKLLTISLLFPLLIIAAYFTVQIAGAGPYETADRIHMRYYNFLFPLVFIIVASLLNKDRKLDGNTNSLLFTIFVCAVLGLSLLYVAVTRNSIPRYLADSPELFGFIKSKKIIIVLISINLTFLLWWVMNKARGARLYAFIYIPLMLMLSSMMVNSELRKNILPSIHDEAGLAAKIIINNEVSRLVVVSSDHAGLYRALFHVDSRNAQMTYVPINQTIERSILPQNCNWLLMIGNYRLGFVPKMRKDFSGYSIIKVSQ